ncbi:MAG: hypothetical protein ACUVUG_08890 [Candidatus Aminicenantia bacterium]
MKAKVWFITFSLIMILFPLSSNSEELGIKTGFAIGDLDQFFLGITTPIYLEKLLYFQPTLEFGAGDNAVSLYLSMDFSYRIRRNFSVGGGIGILYCDFSKRDFSQTDPSVSLFFQFKYPLRRSDIFWDFRAQISDYSQLRLSFGILL